MVVTTKDAGPMDEPRTMLAVTSISALTLVVSNVASPKTLSLSLYDLPLHSLIILVALFLLSLYR